MQIFADNLSRVTMSNNNIRIELVQNGPDNTTVSVGTLIIPASQASNFVNAMAKSLKQIDEQMKAKSEEGQADTDIQ